MRVPDVTSSWVRVPTTVMLWLGVLAMTAHFLDALFGVMAKRNHEVVVLHVGDGNWLFVGIGLLLYGVSYFFRAYATFVRLKEQLPIIVPIFLTLAMATVLVTSSPAAYGAQDVVMSAILLAAALLPLLADRRRRPPRDDAPAGPGDPLAVPEGDPVVGFDGGDETTPLPHVRPGEDVD